MIIPSRRTPAVSIMRPTYAMATTDGQSAEITMYGDIYEQRPTDWWGDPVEGQFITLSEFLEDLKQIEGCKNITIRMNSYGGDAGVSLTIHNRLRELARSGTKLTCIVDGVAMSGGSLIMCACDTVQANPSSMIMIHKCWSTIIGQYNADELRSQSEKLDSWDKMQSEIYQRKTKLSNTVIMHMMAETTYMTGREAAEKGFVDEILEDAEPTKLAASADGRILFVHGRQVHLAAGLFAPDTIPTVTPGAPAPDEANKDTPDSDGTGSEEGGNPMTIEELRAQYPDEIAQVETEARAAVDTTAAVNAAVQAAVQAERDRLSAIDEVAGLFAPELVHSAKYGDHPMTAAQMTLEAAKTAASQGRKFLANLDDDSAASNTGAVPSAPAADGDTPEAVEADAVAAARAYLKKEGK